MKKYHFKMMAGNANYALIEASRVIINALFVHNGSTGRENGEVP